MTAARIRPVAVFLVYAYAISSPFSLGAATTTGLVLLAVGLAVLALHPPARRAIPLPVAVGLLGMITWSAVATATADPYPVKWVPWAKELWIKVMMVSIVALVVATRMNVERLLLVYLTAATVVAGFGIWQHFFGRIPFQDDIPPMKGERWEIEAFYNHHLTYGGHVVAAWLLAVSRGLFSGGSLRRPRFAALTVLSCGVLGLALFWSYARSAHVGAAVGMVFLALFLAPRRRLAVAAVMVVGVVAILAQPTMRDRFAELLDPASEQTRLNLWRSSAHAISDRPWTGTGVGNFREMLERHEVEGEYDTRAHAHNDYIMHAVNAGLPHLGFVLVLAIGVLVVLVRRRGEPGVKRWIVLGVAGAHVSLAVGGVFQVFQTDDEVEMTLYFLLGCALAHLAQTRRQATTASPGLPSTAPQPPWGDVAGSRGST